MSHRKLKLGWVGPVDRYWEWIQCRLGSIEVLPIEHKFAEGIREWVSESEESIVLVALEDRYSTLSRAFHALIAENISLDSSKKKRAKSRSDIASNHQGRVLGILGEAWEGHRRTYPILEQANTFYWYELFDRLLPILDTQERVRPSQHSDGERGHVISESTDRLERFARVRRWMDLARMHQADSLAGKRCLIVADSSSIGESWVAILQTMGSSALVIEPEQGARVRFQPDLIVVDLEEPPRLASRQNEPIASKSERIRSEWAWIERRFPNAMSILVDAFPRWEDWSVWSTLGFDVFLPRPFSSFGIAWASQKWEQSA